MGAYPPAVLADLAVQLLAEASGGAFTPATALARGTSTTRGATAAQGCCLATNLSFLNNSEGNPFYFARDAERWVHAGQRPRAHARLAHRRKG